VVTALFASHLPVMFGAQMLHAFGFAIFHACCMRQMSEFFPGKRAAAGQSLLYGFSSGVGGVLGAGMSALMWEWAGGRAAFLASAAAAALAWLVYSLRKR
jgi:PPP family 3-phenylpropionic acid transporter